MHVTGNTCSLEFISLTVDNTYHMVKIDKADMKNQADIWISRYILIILMEYLTVRQHLFVKGEHSPRLKQ